MRHFTIQFLVLILCIWILNSCDSDIKDTVSGGAVFELVDSKHSNIHFNNEITDFSDMHINTRRGETYYRDK